MGYMDPLRIAAHFRYIERREHGDIIPYLELCKPLKYSLNRGSFVGAMEKKKKFQVGPY